MAEPLIAVHNAVALTPIAFRFRIEPDQGAGALLDGGQKVQARIGIVRPGVSEEDDRGVSVELI